MMMTFFRFCRRVLVPALTLAACSSHNTTAVPDAGGDSGGVATCASEATSPSLTKNGYAACTPCQFPNITPALQCTDSKPINACCDYLQDPRVELARATGLHYFSAPAGQTDVDLGCLDSPGTLGTPQTVSVEGYVKLFSTGDDSAGVKIEMFKEGANGALGAPVGTPVVTMDTDPYMDPKPTWSTKCPQDGCTLRHFKYDGVPTETPLIVKTSDAASSQKWSELYDYNVYFSNAKVQSDADAGVSYVDYDANAVAATDVNTVASAAGGFTIKPDKGVIAGEIHDCGDVRLSGATVNTDYRPEGDIFYFGEDESNPLPDKTRTAPGLGTSKLGLFGGLNYPTGTPIRVSAIGLHNGQKVLVGTYIVQVYPGAVTALSIRGRRPWQQ